MAVKTFTSGETLTAGDTNTYLNNGGLVYVTSATIGVAVSSVTVSSVFSSTYDSYKIVISGMKTSITSPIVRLQLSGITTSYFTSMVYQLASTSTINGYNETNVSYWAASIGANENSRIEIDLFGMNGATGKMGNSEFAGYDNNSSYGGSTFLVNTSGAVSTGFVLSSSSGTLSNGTITVYGYRKA